MDKQGSVGVSEIVQADGLDAGRFASLLHLLAKVVLGEGEQPIGRVRLVQGVQVHPEHICQLRRDGQHAAALRRLRLCHDLFAVDRLEALVDRERAVLQVDVCRSQGQQLTDAQAGPEQNGQAGSAWELRHVLDNLRELIHRPELHFICVLFADGEAISQAYSDVRSDVEKLCQAYDDAYQAAKDSFEGQFDLFDQASTKSSDYLNASVSNAQAALDSQLNYWNTYTANIETLKATSADDLGITEENYKALMSYVQDGSEQAAGLAASMVQSINSGNKDAVAKLADTLADVTAKQDAAAQATADWVTDYENQLDDFQKKMEGTVDSLDLSDEAGKAAKDTIAEYVQKLKDGKKDAAAAAKDVAASVALALQNGSTPSVTTSTTTTVPGHAGGTTDAEDVFVAGENGPELIVGKQGSTVFPTEETDKIIDALNGMEPASDTSNEKKFDQFLQALTGVTVDAPEPGPGESLFDSVLGKVADIVSGKNSDLEAINAAYTGLPGVSTVALPASNAPIAAEAAPLNVQPNAQPAAQESTAATKEIAKRIILEIVGNGSVVVSGGSGGGMSEKAVLELLTNNIKPVLMGVIKDEIFEEGQLSYDY